MSSPDTVVDFDTLGVGTEVTTQYQDLGNNQGVVFLDTVHGGGLIPVIAQVTPGEAHSGTHVANISVCEGCEFFVPFAIGLFTSTVQHISVYVGQFDSQSSDPAQITLSAFDAGHNLIAQSAPVTAVAGAGFNTLLSVSSTSPNIASFEISARSGIDSNKQIGIDDLTFGGPQALPDFSLSLAPQVIEVAPGTSSSTTLTVARLNNSAGKVQLSTTPLPQGITLATMPGATLDATTLTFSAAPDAPLTGVQGVSVVVTATPSDANTGPTSRSVTLELRIRLDFSILRADTSPVVLIPCTSTQVTLEVFREINFQIEPITLSISGLPPSIQATFNPPSPLAPPPGGSFVNTVVLTLTEGVGATISNISVTVTASNGSQISRLILSIAGGTGAIDSFSPTSGSTPQLLRPGTEVVVTGSGFCSGSLVAFGSDMINGQFLAVAAPTFLSADGRELHVNVPRLATTGPITILPPTGGSIPSGATFTVYSYRDANGFSFPNYGGPGFSFDDVQELFGYDQTHLSIFGYTLPIPDPLAWIFSLIASAALGGNGLCFGFSLSSLRLLHGEEPFSAFNPSGSTEVWQLVSEDKLRHYIHIQHLAQLSSEFLNAFIGNALSNKDSTSTRNQITQLLAQGSEPLISLRHGSDGHVVVAYDIEDSQTAPGDYYIDVYNPNDPFQTAENQVGTLHQGEEQNPSRIFVSSNTGHWTLQDPNWDGDFWNLAIAPYATVPIQPTIPTSFTGLITLIFGESGQTEQVTDGVGHTLFRPDGTLNTDPATRLPQATPFAPLIGMGKGSDMLLLGGDGPYTQTVRNTGSTGYSHTFFGRNLGTRIENDTATPGVKDQFTFDPLTTSLRFSTGDAKRGIKAQLLARTPDNDVYSAIINTTNFKDTDDSMAFDGDRKALTYTHTGAATTCSLTLEASSQNGIRLQFVSPSLPVHPHDQLAFAPSDWKKLAAATVTLTRTMSDGTQRVEVLKNQKPPIAVHIFGGDPGVIYVVTAAGDLFWFKDLAFDGTVNWANNGAGKKIASGWDFTHVFYGGDGIIYAVTARGDLLWFKDLALDGTANWANNGAGKKIASNWNYAHVFSGGNGVIYAISGASADLLWFKDLARNGTAHWANNGAGKKIGARWSYNHVLADGSVIYTTDEAGNLYWHQDLAGDGKSNWAFGGHPRQIGTGWNYPYIFSGGDGGIYVITSAGQLLWFKDLAGDGKSNWANNGVGQQIATGWSFQ